MIATSFCTGCYGTKHRSETVVGYGRQALEMSTGKTIAFASSFANDKIIQSTANDFMQRTMDEPKAPIPPLDELLRRCAAAAPEPWYPSDFARETGCDRDSLYRPINDLRMNGLIAITNHVDGKGQGYVVTEEGEQVLRDPKRLAQLHDGQIPKPAPARQREELPQLEPANWARAKAAREIFHSPEPPRVTSVLLLINVAVFVAGIILAAYQGIPVSQVLAGTDYQIQWQTGSADGYSIIQGQWWRLLTCCFVHIGLLHLVFNVYSLYVIGPLVERMWGHALFLVLYLVSGIGGSVFMLLENPIGGGAGASTALWGLLGSMAAWWILNRNVLPREFSRAFGSNVLVIIVLNLFITFSFAGISKGGHLGGGTIGFLATFALDRIRFGTARQRVLAVLALIGLFVVPFTFLDRERLRHLVYQFDPRIEQRDVNRVNQTLVPNVGRILDRAYSVRAETDKIIQQEPAARNEDEWKRARESVAGLRKDIDHESKRLEEMTPFRNPRVEMVRVTAIRLLEAWSNELQQVEAILRAGDQTTEQQKRELREREKTRQEEMERWDKFFER
ncbi:MAG: hypothetical protein KatS3mg105_0980 [Gemmatales bacterium]|nr:MAG: hypothetical protein KatS3mg105_0980 [Gemmatales bacterium]